MRLDEFLELEKDNILKKYKAESSSVLGELRDSVSRIPGFLKIIENAEDIKDIQKRKEYKLFSKKARKDIYYSLRQYHRAGDEHISTKERAPYLEEFLSPLIQRYPDLEIIMDIGGGLFPAAFPFEKFPKLQYYIWVDRDKKAYEELRKLNNPKIKLYNESIGEHPWKHYLPEGYSEFDLAMLIKLISVVWRQEKDLIPLLTAIPAKTLFVTIPKESMTKKESVEHRERATLSRFVQLSGRKLVGTSDIQNELGYFLEK